jgi:phage shock protein A
MYDLFKNLIACVLGSVGPQATIASLDRSVAAAGAAHLTARRAFAVAVAEEARETDRRTSMTAKVADLEARAVAAIRAGREDLALSASETIALVRTEIEASEHASVRFAQEAIRVRREVDVQRLRLADLDRGRRLARVGIALNLPSPTAGSQIDHLAAAEATLAKVNADNADWQAVREAMACPVDRLTDRMSEEGFGQPLTVKASDVMARLRTMAATPILIEPSREMSAIS